MTNVTSYKGYSTADAERTRTWTRYDVDLVKRDLLNHFMTRIGERVMRPDFGCRVWDYLSEPGTPANREAIIQDVVRICKSDPRVALRDVNLFDYDNGIRIEITLDFLGLAAMQTFSVLFQSEESTAYGQTV